MREIKAELMMTAQIFRRNNKIVPFTLRLMGLLFVLLANKKPIPIYLLGWLISGLNFVTSLCTQFNCV